MAGDNDLVTMVTYRKWLPGNQMISLTDDVT